MQCSSGSPCRSTRTDRTYGDKAAVLNGDTFIAIMITYRVSQMLNLLFPSDPRLDRKLMKETSTDLSNPLYNALPKMRGRTLRPRDNQSHFQ